MTTKPPSEAAVLQTLQSVFGFDALRPLQHEAIHSILSGRDTFVLMPTGGGKSLCYQLPALVRPGMTVVVSPLIALMKDQVDHLEAKAVAATFINSSLDAAENNRRRALVLNGDVKILYLAPERLVMPSTINLLSKTKVSLFAIDEAHCISEWGHDFRPEYRALSGLRHLFPSATIAAFTATATKRVQADIVTQLRLRQPLTLRGSLNRQNLHYQVWPKKDTYIRLAGYLRKRGRASGIIYIQSRNGADELAERLRGDRFSAASYHAGLEADERRKRQDAFIKGTTRIVVATIAFGMGIDKSDVRFVVHHDLPRNLEAYYQESGRAGRDGTPADCILFFSHADTAKQRRFIDEKPSAAEREIGHAQLRQVVAWAEGVECRRRALLGYFDEVLDAPPTPCCDNCENKPQERDYTVEAQKFLSCVKRTGEGFGLGYIVRVLLGSRDERILANKHDQLSTYGVGRSLTREEWHHLAAGLVSREFLELASLGAGRPANAQVAKVTPLGAEVLFQGRKVSMTAPRADAPPNNDAEAPAAPVGARAALAAGAVLGTSGRVTLDLFKKGLDVQQIALRRGVVRSTVEGHLVEALEAGEQVDVARLVDASKRPAIEAALKAAGDGPLAPVLLALGQGYTYGEIRFVRADLRRAKPATSTAPA